MALVTLAAHGASRRRAATQSTASLAPRGACAKRAPRLLLPRQATWSRLLARSGRGRRFFATRRQGEKRRSSARRRGSWRRLHMELLPPMLLCHLITQRTSPGSRASRSSSRGEGAAPCRRRGALQLPATAGAQAGTRHMGRSQLTGWPCPRMGSVHLRLRNGALAERNTSGLSRTRRLLLLRRHRSGSVVRRGRRRYRINWRRDRGSRVGHRVCSRAVPISRLALSAN